MSASISLHNITKLYGQIRAVDDFSLAVEKGTIFGLLGPNGAGKTTLINILTTLSRPTAGEAFVEGYSTLTQARAVRAVIGVVPQLNNLDRYLTARENLVLHARMHGMHPSAYNRRIDELLDLTGLKGRQHDFPDVFSGGMQRRLVVARALVHEPLVLFLDEPTTGLDPQSRRAVWDYIQALKEKMTIFLTTHYMDEADTLCERIVIMDKGKALVDGSAAQLKGRLDHARIYEVEFRANADRYEETLRRLPYVVSLERKGNIFRVALTGEDALKPLMDCIGSTDIRKVCLQEPSLEDVFIELTGREVRE
ncbi:MAG TPA: ATP-binding cassette domain-containing protein [Geobacteraceae bacterium]|nr:ATP-binding cassette domain-containing protein [Geobacteraceae bacterium]